MGQQERRSAGLTVTFNCELWVRWCECGQWNKVWKQKCFGERPALVRTRCCQGPVTCEASRTSTIGGVFPQGGRDQPNAQTRRPATSSNKDNSAQESQHEISSALKSYGNIPTAFRRFLSTVCAGSSCRCGRRLRLCSSQYMLRSASSRSPSTIGEDSISQ